MAARAKHLEQLPEQQRNEAAALVRGLMFDRKAVAGKEEKIDSVLLSDFRVPLFLASLVVLSKVQNKRDVAESVSTAIARMLEKHGPDFHVDDLLDWDSQTYPEWRSRVPKPN